MSISSVSVSDKSITAFHSLKLGKKLKYIIFALNDEKTEIVVEKTSSSTDYADFLEDLPEADCRYAIYDFEYTISQGEGKRSKIVFFSWSPDDAKIRNKMVYASSRDGLRRALNGVYADIQGTDLSEVSYDTVLEKINRSGAH
ncbi:cofilin ASCRUDRAFT_76258 [Ascoidea rubescens DSM 1968]|uniref:Cofilin n=1 Tax=Ascoidea rubescens DSM 1968 TaxID=1344418 RepID=A0A1D2VH79_9ASCO|nr:hypothetical protein ASCRUDRAFT_76258 [Ascoidea rubescens DSM 1968]ODV60910.1 hypothetical protein ASCRUDRAFT_76258 [Ascoidea rubescens DSM 1968]